MDLTALGLGIAHCLRDLAVALRIGPDPHSCTYKPVRGKAMASRQELADVAQAAEALCVLLSLPAAAVAVAWEALRDLVKLRRLVH